MAIPLSESDFYKSLMAVQREIESEEFEVVELSPQDTRIQNVMQPKIDQLEQALAMQTTMQASVSDAVVSSDTVQKCLSASNAINWGKIANRACTFFACVVLGAFTALLLSGLMINPIFWGIVGVALIISLATAIAKGGVKELGVHLGIGASGFLMGWAPTAAFVELATGMKMSFGYSFASLFVSVVMTSAGMVPEGILLNTIADGNLPDCDILEMHRKAKKQ